MTYKIGVFGSGGGLVSPKHIQDSAARLGQALGERGEEITVITGACTGLPYIAATEAAKHGKSVWGFSPVTNEAEQREFTPDDDLGIYAKIDYIPADAPFTDNRRVCMKYRNVMSTAACDAGIIMGGRWGSLNEFTNLLDMQKVVGVLTGSGGVADEIPELNKRISKEGQGPIVFSDDPTELLDKVFELLKQQS